MSTYTDASLIVTPNSKKAGKLYSLKGADLDVVRATIATYVGSDGLIKTALANEVRFDYTNGSCPAILVEPQRTNLVSRNDDFTINPWLYSGANISPTTAINSPDGTYNAFELNILNTGFSQFGQIINVANNTTYTISCFYKNKNMTLGQTFEFRYTNELAAPNNVNAIATINLVAGTATFSLNGTEGSGKSGSATGTVQNYGNGWFRVAMTFTVGSSGASTAGRFRPAVGINIERNFYVYGAQFEVGSNATSYIPTTTSSVTRNADVISKTGISNLIGQTEGTLFLDASSFNFLGTGVGERISFTDGTFNNRMAIELQSATAVSLIASNSTLGLTGTINSTTGLISPNNRFKIAIAYAGSNSILYVNGVAFSTIVGTIPTFTGQLTKFEFNQGNGSRPFYGKINSVLSFKTRLSNLELQQLTTL